MKILAISSELPNRFEPYKGIYNLELLKYQAKFNNIMAICPVATQSHFSKQIKTYLKLRKKEDKLKQDLTYTEALDDIKIYYPNILYSASPKVKRSSALIMFTSMLPFIWRIREKFKFDLIHAFNSMPEGLATMLIARFLKIPAVVTHSGNELMTHKHKNYFSNKIDYYFIAKSNKHIVTSKALKSELAKDFGLTNGKAQIVYNGVDILKFFPKDKIQARTDLGLPLNRKILVYIGNIDSQSGVNYLIDAMEILYVKNKNISLYIIGDGRLKKAMQRKIHKVYLKNHIFIRTDFNYEDIPTWMNAADLFVNPDLTENIQTKITQALACGTPVVANRYPNVADIIPSADLGLLTEPRDCEDLAKKISIGLEKVWNEYELVTRAKSYSLHKVAGTLQQCYEKLVVPS